MSLSHREIWTAVHGMVLGALFLLAFTGGFAALWGLKHEWVTPEGARRGAVRLILMAWTMAILAWGTVIVGTYVVYPWYRAKPPGGVVTMTTPAALAATDPSPLANYPKYQLVASEKTAEWHEFGMEWKEHVGWFAPMLATAVAFVATKYRGQIAQDKSIRRAMLVLFTISFGCAAVAGLLGALINKVAPTR